MGFFKNKKEERECYINKRLEDASKLSDDDLKKAKYLKEFELIELKEAIKKSSVAILITILLTLVNIAMSSTTLINSFLDSSIKNTEIAIDLTGDTQEDQKKEIVEILAETIQARSESVVIAIKTCSAIIIISLIYVLGDKVIEVKQNKKRALMEIELNILLDEIKYRENVRSENNIKNSKSVIDELENKNIIKEVAIDETDKNNK